MIRPLTELIAVLGAEVRVGDELLLNLAAQKKAILSWNSSALLGQVEEKEALVRQLAVLEEKRQKTVPQLLPCLPDCSTPAESLSLSELLAQLLPGPQTAELAALQRQAREIYSRLRAEEKNLATLMGTILGHLREALGCASQPAISLYGERGTLTSPRPTSGLVQGKI